MKIQSLFCYSLLVIIPCFITSCKDETETKIADPDVYLVGETSSEDFFYYLNNQKFDLPHAGEKSRVSNAIIHNGDLYMAGYDATNPQAIGVLWKNDKIEKLYTEPSGKSYYWARVAYDGNDRYLAFTDPDFVTTYFKNDQKVKSFNGGLMYALGVQNTDVYICGYKEVSNNSVATLWKNGVETILEELNENYFTSADDLAVSGADVYVVYLKNYNGDVKDEAILWKNGEKTILPSNSDAQAYSIFIAGKDVYAAGYSTESKGAVRHATYWKNGVKVVLDNSTEETEVYDIAVSKSGKVYALGAMGNEYKPVLWIDGKLDPVFNGTKKNDESLYYICLKEK